MSVKNTLFKKELKVINVGLEIFHDAVRKQKVCSVHVEWKPPAAGDEKLQAILAKLR